MSYSLPQQLMIPTLLLSVFLLASCLNTVSLRDDVEPVTSQATTNTNNRQVKQNNIPPRATNTPEKPVVISNKITVQPAQPSVQPPAMVPAQRPAPTAQQYNDNSAPVVLPTLNTDKRQTLTTYDK